MRQREPDDTTKPDAPPTRGREPGSYYYDDATGYELYDPDEDDEEGLDESKTDAQANERLNNGERD